MVKNLKNGTLPLELSGLHQIVYLEIRYLKKYLIKKNFAISTSKLQLICLFCIKTILSRSKKPITLPFEI